jgi:hypothetical protein
LSDKRSHALEELRSWTRAREYWDRAVEYLKLARTASDPDVQSRFVAIARHYRMLADAEECSAKHKGTERRSRNERESDGRVEKWRNRYPV